MIDMNFAHLTLTFEVGRLTFKVHPHLIASPSPENLPLNS